jgi:hypothetical protein
LTAINTADVVDMDEELDEHGNPVPKPMPEPGTEMDSFSGTADEEEEDEEDDDDDDNGVDDGDSVLEPGIELDVDAEVDPVLRSVLGTTDIARVQVSDSKPSLRHRITSRLKKFVYLAKFGLVGKKKPKQVRS